MAMVILNNNLDPRLFVSIAKLTQGNDHLWHIDVRCVELAWNCDSCNEVVCSWDLLLNLANEVCSLCAHTHAATSNVVRIGNSDIELSALV